MGERRAVLAGTLEAGARDVVDRGGRLTIGWEQATPTWRTARLSLRKGDAEVVVFEDAGELVCIPHPAARLAPAPTGVRRRPPDGGRPPPGAGAPAVIHGGRLRVVAIVSAESARRA
ncbi:hypothetical protein [Cellulomonas xiejunii]|uniref:Uncharacterized protein n=1 Tax=Cellulomonas xiejunii TaxID=2968083 RepID=A0ABY5KUJ9_9CELL|nr:hypothetical protein [Cellulomonas xiejunii]UUI72876.1 hypothetical protein NP048_05365 [Cellulomonas xiejunii]